MNIKLLLYVCAFFLLCGSSHAQTASDELLKKYVVEVKNKISEESYTEANEIFIKLFQLKAVFPDEVAYFYGYTQLNLGNYIQARDAFKKYISLQGDSGQYSQYAQEYINLADCKEKGYYSIEETCDECEGTGSLEKDCHTCRGKGQEVCNICFGSGVLRKQDNFGETFETCKKCVGKGYYECTQCHGTLHQKSKCFLCDGKGKLKVRQECTSIPQRKIR